MLTFLTVTSHLTVYKHVRDVISKCGQSIHAFKLQQHGINKQALKAVYKAVIQPKLTYKATPTICEM